ncbi:Uncharacterized protein TPAR_08285, partial [Tolypocladium paradoxum]
MAAAQPHNLEDLVRAVESHHEQYIRSLRGLHDGLAIRRRERADSRSTLPPAMTPPLRALTNPTFVGAESGSNTNYYSYVTTSPSLPHPGHLASRPRRPTLETTAERPPSSLFPSSPRPLHDHQHDLAIPPDEELSFIPLLDA